MDSHIEGCPIPECGVCVETESVLDEVARRLGADGFVPSTRQRREMRARYGAGG